MGVASITYAVFAGTGVGVNTIDMAGVPAAEVTDTVLTCGAAPAAGGTLITVPPAVSMLVLRRI